MKNSEFIGADKTVRPAPEKEYPPVLDVCCGPKMMWFNKNDSRALYVDIRQETHEIKNNSGRPPQKIQVLPDNIADFTSLPYPDNTFSHIVFDPPHCERNQSGSFLGQIYGTLYGKKWDEMLKLGFSECFRVLKPSGTLVFKWSEEDIPVREILALTTESPLYGHRSGKRAQTHWICFIKGIESPVLGEESAQENKEVFPTSPNKPSAEICANHIAGASCPYTTFHIECGPLPCKLAPRKLSHVG